jgi:hypothetical protein
VMFTSTAVLLGVAFGGAPAIVSAVFLFFSRSARQARNLLTIGVGYAVVGGSVIVSLVLLLSTVGQHSYNRFSAILAYAISYVFGILLLAREEIKWRKSVGIR